jgi:hypothetical protein
MRLFVPRYGDRNSGSTLVYELAERGLNELIRRGIVPERSSPYPKTRSSRSRRALVGHSNLRAVFFQFA